MLLVTRLCQMTHVNMLQKCWIISSLFVKDHLLQYLQIMLTKIKTLLEKLSKNTMMVMFLFCRYHVSCLQMIYLLSQDIWHAQQRVIKSMSRSHHDYSMAVLDFKGIFRDMQKKVYTTPQHFATALDEWSTQYSVAHKSKSVDSSIDLLGRKLLEEDISSNLSHEPGIVTTRVKWAVKRLMVPEVRDSLYYICTIDAAQGMLYYTLNLIHFIGTSQVETVNSLFSRRKRVSTSRVTFDSATVFIEMIIYLFNCKRYLCFISATDIIH